MNANEFAELITEMIFVEKETILEAFESEDEKMLRDEIYELYSHCN